MMMRNLGGRWGYVAKALHWSAAALIITMLSLGLSMVHGGLGSGAKFET
jgi:cytochrome b561